MASAIFILAPDRDLYFSIRGRALYESLFEIRDDGVDVYRRLVFDLDRYWSVNDSRIRLLTRA